MALNNPLKKRGAFIVVEGVDRAGKSTQVKMLQDYIIADGSSCVIMRFPDRTTATGSIINNYLAGGVTLDDHAIHLLFSANRWEASKTILDHLANGTHVICDRYAYSGVAFTASKSIDIEWCKNPDRGLPRPDAVFYLDLRIEDALERGGFGMEVYEKEDIQRRVKDIYEKYLFDCSYWTNIDARGSKEEIHVTIRGLLDPILASMPSQCDHPLLLWSHFRGEEYACE